MSPGGAPRWLAPAVYLAVTLLVAGPLLAPGFVFALDHAVGPRSADYYAGYLSSNADPIQSKAGFAVILTVLTHLMPIWLAQKLLLFAPFFLAGWGMHRLTRAQHPVARFFGGLLYMLSAFAYVRGVAGQIGVLWSYALAPWFLIAYLRATREGDRGALVAAVLLVALTAAFQAQGALLLGALVLAHTLVRLARSPVEWRATLRAPALLLVGVVAVNAYWIVPVLSTPETTLTRIGEGDRAFFATTSAGFPSVGLAALTLQGFWRGGYETFYSGSALWLLVPTAFLLLAVHGLRVRPDSAAVALAACGALGLVLGVGEGSRWTAPLFGFAWDHVPFFRGFRDSQKLLALLALAYAALAPVGAEDLLRRARSWRWPRAAPAMMGALLLAAPVASAAPLLDGYHGQLGVSEYPPGWAAANEATRACAGSMLVLPWHLYLDLPWLPNHDKRVTDPAKLYFECPVVVSDNVEAGRTASQSTSEAGRYADFWLEEMGVTHGNPRAVGALGNLLAPANVQYVLVLKSADWRAQDAAMRAQRDLRPMLENADVVLYENEAPRGLAPSGPEIPIRSWSDLQPLSENRTLSDARLPPALAIGAGTRPAEPSRLVLPSAIVSIAALLALGGYGWGRQAWRFARTSR